MKNYNRFCKESGCDRYIEWEYEHGGSYGPPHLCTSCMDVGQSFDIERYPDDCPNLEEIQKIKLSPKHQ